MALSAATIPTIVGEAILESLTKNLVYGNLYNQDYMGEVAPGNAVKIPSIGSVSVGDYTEYTDMDDENASDSSQTMNISEQKFFSIVLDDIDSAMSKPAVMAAYAREASNQMAATVDSFLATTLATGGTLTSDLGDDTTPLEVNSASIGSTLRAMATKLDLALVPRNGRYVVLPPELVAKLVAANITDETNNSAVLADSYVTRYAGFDVLMSHQVPNTAGDKFKVVAGSNISATMALAINETEMIRHPTQFADKLRGLAVFGGLVTRPATVAVATCNVAAE